ncbi:carbohydrate ABC transporter ATP-binding protein [Rubellimicrobium thermophilum DSM 16684]|uniref:Carbohydrate ABC transporter ATP-binding protein n=1 Tax=Rubellimicrobium thermophilum DSM 16684 TaxID=1123069 RepID=S9QS27_9RHOB|nr:sn-glycerol-3-phosphate ABC transporter ATP-binding protein UgpC [Rubellimicrobium thermophilum]EPX82437.1 carbohydrate ABC transporter ATP-binding protein [Rubellimicrobium thermophilum DSM 16684]
MTSVAIRALRKSYGTIPVIRDVSIDIEDGEFVVLVGPSGCGKSTLLRMIAGLETVSDGEICMGSRVINDVAAKDRDIAMVFQSYALYPHMTVAENMAFSLRLKGIARAERDRRIAKVGELLGLGALLKRYPRQLSGGQRQRVAMGRAIVRDPQVFLFDEPLSNLDAKLRVEMRSEIKALQHRLKITTIYVTHDQIEAMTMADRIVVMRDGRVEQCDTPLDLYDRPANMFVAAFIGSPAMNFLHGMVEKRNSGCSFMSCDGIELPLPPGAGQLEGRPVVYGIRPEHFGLGGAGSLQARIRLVEPTGSETMVFLRLGETEVVGLFRERIAAREGETIPIRPDPSRIHLFDPDSGRRLI